MQELKLEVKNVREQVEQGVKAERDRKTLEEHIEELKLTVPKEELPCAL